MANETPDLFDLLIDTFRRANEDRAVTLRALYAAGVDVYAPEFVAPSDPQTLELYTKWVALNDINDRTSKCTDALFQLTTSIHQLREDAEKWLTPVPAEPAKRDVKLYSWRKFHSDKRGPYVSLPGKAGRWYFKEGMACHKVFDEAGTRAFTYCTAISATAAFYLRIHEEGLMAQVALVEGW